MRKKGFTLAEILVALGIVAVISVLLAPQIVSLFPNEDKLKVLKAYETLSKINEEILNDPGAYIIGERCKVDGEACDCSGLNCINAPLDTANYGNVSGVNKYYTILTRKLKTNNTPVISGNWYMFETKDGISWTGTSVIEEDCKIHYLFTIDVNGDKGPNVSYSAQTKNPDRYVLRVDNYGVVSGEDLLSKAFLASANKLQGKSADVNEADVLK